MEDAIAAVKNGQIKVIRAAKVYSVPKSTLHDVMTWYQRRLNMEISQVLNHTYLVQKRRN